MVHDHIMLVFKDIWMISAKKTISSLLACFHVKRANRMMPFETAQHSNLLQLYRAAVKSQLECCVVLVSLFKDGQTHLEGNVHVFTR